MKNKTQLNNYDNSGYHPGNKLKILIWYITNRFFINTYFPIPKILKIQILKLFGAQIGSGLALKPKVNIKYPWFLEIGNNVWIGEKAWIDNLTKVKIGNNVCISQESYFLTGNHNYKKTSFDLILGEITIEDGAWIGAKSIVCPGVTCKSHSILSVNSVATNDLESYSIYQGNPAKFVRERKIVE